MPEPEANNLKCVYDPLAEMMAYYADAKTAKRAATDTTNLSIEDKLKARIVDGEKLGLEADLKAALEKYPALDIINHILLDGMKTVGDLFGSGQMQLPFVLQSAETMKTAVRFLEPFMERVEGMAKGTIVLATVKGDVHDIGKNLVDIILTNNGYKVVNLGIKCPIETMLQAAIEHQADAIGMSGLLVKSTLIMKENLEVMNQRGVTIPVILGGAALTRRYVEQDLRAIYHGLVAYANDAFAGLHFMEEMAAHKAPPAAPVFSLESVLREMKAGRERLLALLAEIPAELFNEPGTFNEWSLRDLLAHLIGWERKSGAILAGTEQVSSYSEEEVNEINARLIREITTRGKGELIAELEQARARVIELLKRVPEAKWGPDKLLARWLPECTYAHEEGHRRKIEAWWVTAAPRAQEGLLGAEAKQALAAEAERAERMRTQGAALDTALHLQQDQERRADFQPAVRVKDDGSHQKVSELTSHIRRDVPIPAPPFLGSKVIENVRLEKVFEYLNETALIRGQWQVHRGRRAEAEFQEYLREKIYPQFEALKLRVKRERLLTPRVVYGYFPCQAEGNDLVIYRPGGEAPLHEVWRASFDGLRREELAEWMRFSFPRQREERHLCISDFFRPAESGELDVVAFHLVTMGERASEHAAELFQANNYTDYLYFHGLSVESAEALAEYWHKAIRTELGIAGRDATQLKKLFGQGYQGSRYSFGYPACPNLEDQAKLFELLRPERIGVRLSEGFQLHPEQSTSAIIVHHEEARYFNIRG
jgi:cobalamin-dependent methionine synthase I